MTAAHEDARHHPLLPQPHPGASGHGPAEHTEAEDHGWEIDIPDHPARTESADFRAAKTAAHKILALVRHQNGSVLLEDLAGPAGVQAHHAGSLWVYTGGRWAMFLNAAGIEWSAQWAADPAKVDLLRLNALVLYGAFPDTLPELAKLGYPEAANILHTPITDPAGVARWTDSLFNSCVLLSPALHQSIVSKAHPVGGWHHYPKSIWDQQLTKRTDFNLWVVDALGYEHAVAPMGPRGSGDARVHVLWSHPASPLHVAHQAHEAAGKLHVLDAGHELAHQAFAQQT